jgi:hypothetical protein
VIDTELALRALEVPGNPLSPREVEVLRRFAAILAAKARVAMAHAEIAQAEPVL